MSLFDNKVECNNGTFDISNGAVAPCLNSGGVKAPKSKFDFSGLSQILNGTTGFPSISKPSVITNDMNLETQKQKLAYEQAKYNLEKAMYNTQNNTQNNTTKEPIYYILVTAGVMIAGYFAYKKFKK
jgi:hypothetical protein